MAVTAPTAQEISALLTVIATLVPMAVAGAVTWFIGRRRPASAASRRGQTLSTEF